MRFVVKLIKQLGGYTVEKAFKFRVYPNQEQQQLIHKTFGCHRFVYNHFLAKRIDAYEKDKATLGYYDCCAELTMLKQEFPWLREVDATALQAALKDLDNAYKGFFRRVKNSGKPGFPRFKSKKLSRRSYKSKRVGDNIAVADGYIKLPKLGLVRYAMSRPVEGRILSATVSHTPSGKYFVSLCCADVAIASLPATGESVGIDMGLHDLAVTSDGECISNPNHLRRLEKKLARLQRSLSRKTIGSKNREMARIEVARVHEQIANRRNDTLHKLSTRLVRDHDVICVEDLAPANMVRNRRLAKSITDAAWGELTRQLRYKCEWYGKAFVTVNRFYPSSQLCSECGHRYPGVKDLAVRHWVCPNCGAVHDRDHNAAVNIKNEGLRLLSA